MSNYALIWENIKPGGRTDGRTAGRAGGRTDGRMGERVDWRRDWLVGGPLRTDERTGEMTAGRAGGRTDGRMGEADGWMQRKENNSLLNSAVDAWSWSPSMLGVDWRVTSNTESLLLCCDKISFRKMLASKWETDQPCCHASIFVAARRTNDSQSTKTAEKKRLTQTNNLQQHLQQQNQSLR